MKFGHMRMASRLYFWIRGTANASETLVFQPMLALFDCAQRDNDASIV